MISIIHPSRGRPEKSFNTIKKWIDNTSYNSDTQILISLDDDDNTIRDYFKLFASYVFEYNISVLHNPNVSAVEAINVAATHAKGNILMVVSDDTDCYPWWDEALLKEVEGKEDWILKTQDGIQPYIITMPVMDRKYYERFGYIYHPDYRHLFCDTELTCVADLTGRKLYTSELLFPHNHYSIGKSVKDDVSTKADATHEQGKKLFLERMRRKFDLKETPGRITDHSILNWARNQGVKIPA